ncbi:MAG TPA: flavin reductase family protein [bacterium]|nr:flavin reductase family protein [bacterium]
MDKLTLAPATYLYPAPVVVVSCGVGERANLITLAWAANVCADPPQLAIAVRPNRHSHPLIAEAGGFVVNLPAAGHVGAVDFCGTFSGRDVDKWRETGLTPVPSEKVAPPRIGEFPVNIECALRHTLPLGSHDLFVGEVLSVHVARSVAGEDGRVDSNRLASVVYGHGRSYYGLGGTLGKAFQARRKKG